MHFQIAGVRPVHVSISAANCAIWLRQHEKQGPRDGHFSPKVTDAPGVRAHMSLHSAPPAPDTVTKPPDDASTIFYSPPSQIVMLLLKAERLTDSIAASP